MMRYSWRAFFALWLLAALGWPVLVQGEVEGEVQDETLAEDAVTTGQEATPGSGIFRHVGPDGRVLFTDQPLEDAEPVDIRQDNRYGGHEATERVRGAAARRASGRDLGNPQQVDESLAAEGEAAEDESAQLEARMRDCRRSNIADCSRDAVQRRIEEERYRQTPEGRRQQQAVGNRANPNN